MKYVPSRRAVAPALVFLLGAAVVWLALENRRLREELESMASEANAEIGAPGADGQPLTDGAPAESDDVPEIEALPPTIVWVVLPPEPAKGGDTPRVRLPDFRAFVRLQLDLPRDSGTYLSYRATLRTSTDAVVWSEAQLRAHQTDVGRAVTMTMPSTVLRQEAYELALHGLLSDGADQIAHYRFSIVE